MSKRRANGCDDGSDPESKRPKTSDPVASTSQLRETPAIPQSVAPPESPKSSCQQPITTSPCSTPSPLQRNPESPKLISRTPPLRRRPRSQPSSSEEDSFLADFLHIEKEEKRPSAPSKPQLTACRLYGVDGAVVPKPEDCSEPTFEAALREIALHVIIDTTGDESLLLKLTKLPQIHDIPMYQEKMKFAVRVANNPSIDQDTACALLPGALDIHNQHADQPRLYYQDRLMDYIEEKIFKPMLHTHEWRVMTLVFYIVRELTLRIMSSNIPKNHKEALYEATVDSCYWAIENWTLQGIMSEWKNWTFDDSNQEADQTTQGDNSSSLEKDEDC